MSTTAVTCPRCSGSDNAFTRFGHVNGGRCLLCNGAKVVTGAQAARFLAGVQGGGRGGTRTPHSVASRGTVAPVRTTTAIVAGQPATIERWEAGRYSVMTPAEGGELRSYFGIRDGRVFLDGACIGHLHDLGGMPRGLYVAEEAPHEVRAKQAIRTAIQVAYDAA